jgi:DNA-directed RNA polymerase subunit RPC12/RpoP
MSKFYRTEEMEEGGEFKCYNCGATLIAKIGGTNYKIFLHCHRCKAAITIKMQQPLSKESIENLKS